MNDSPAVHWPTVAAMLLELALCVGLVALALATWHWAVVVPVMIVIATRQHAQFILFHDAVHYNVARDKRLNDAITNAIVGVPQLVPVQLYRRLHLAHHARLGSPADPERLLLYRDQPWRYRALPLRTLARQVLGDLLLVNNVKTLVHFGRELRDPGSLLKLPPARTWPEYWATVALWGGAFAVWLALDPTMALRFLVVWVVPLLTLTQAIQKVRSFAEHGALDDALARTDASAKAASAAGFDGGYELTYSWRPGLFGRLVLWPYHIAFHREHHAQPRVPWYRLPSTFPDAKRRPGRALVPLVWNGRL